MPKLPWTFSNSMPRVSMSGTLRPSAQSAQRIQPAIDCRRSSAGRDHVLAVGDEFVFSEALDGEGGVLDGPVPRQEVAQVVTVAAQRRRREVVTRQAGQEGRHPARFGGASLGCMY